MRLTKLWLTIVVLVIALVIVGIVAAEPSEPTAVDGQRLSDQASDVQKSHKAVYGESAEWAWVAKHNAALYAEIKADRDRLAQLLAGQAGSSAARPGSTADAGAASYVQVYCEHDGTQHYYDTRRYSARLVGKDIIEITYTCTVDQDGNPAWSAEEKNVGRGTCQVMNGTIGIGESRIDFDGNRPDTYLKCIFDASSGSPPWTRMTEISQADYYANKPRESCGVHEGKEQFAGDRWGHTEWTPWTTWNTGSDGVEMRQWHRQYYHCQAAYDPPRVTRVGELQWFPVGVDAND